MTDMLKRINSGNLSANVISFYKSYCAVDIECDIIMSYATEYIATTLRAVRESKGLSQRELSKRAGVPQGHISKIESGAVDLRLSSLTALARALDLELTLVPRKVVPAVKSLARGSERGTRGGAENLRSARKELNRIQNTIASLARIHPGVRELAQFQRQIRELQHFQLAKPDLEALKAASKAVEAFRNDTKSLDVLRQSLSQFQRLRNALAHASVNVPQIELDRPAYRLEEDDDG